MENKKKSKLAIFLIIIDALAIICFFLAYGPISYFRNLLVTTAMTTMSHKYFAYVLYSQEMIDNVLEQNKVIESSEGTDASMINFDPVIETDTYESIYEEQILKRDKDDLYKLIEIDEGSYKGYLIAVYDPSRISLVFSKKLGGGGQKLLDIAKDNKAILMTNASGFSRSTGMRATGTTIKDGKIFSVGKPTNKGGGLIGFNKDNVLVLTKKSGKEAIKNGMRDAVDFGPFLIVNGEPAKFKGNGGWGVANRTAIGQRKDGIVLLLVIDGRSSTSIGASMVDLKDIFVRYKAYNAANLDGGGSSTLIIDNKLINEPQGYGYSGDRYLVNGWMLK